jgi:hypothetical protein
MTDMLHVLVREFAITHGFPLATVYPVIRCEDRKVLALYVRDHGFFPFEAAL